MLSVHRWYLTTWLIQCTVIIRWRREIPASNVIWFCHRTPVIYTHSLLSRSQPNTAFECVYTLYYLQSKINSVNTHSHTSGSVSQLSFSSWGSQPGIFSEWGTSDHGGKLSLPFPPVSIAMKRRPLPSPNVATCHNRLLFLVLIYLYSVYLDVADSI